MHKGSQHDIKCFKIIVKILNSPPNTIFPAITVNYRATYLPSLTHPGSELLVSELGLTFSKPGLITSVH